MRMRLVKLQVEENIYVNFIYYKIEYFITYLFPSSLVKGYEGSILISNEHIQMARNY